MLRRHFSWQLVRSQQHPDFATASHEYLHTRLKSRLVHLENSETNKVFSVLFKTTPQDDRGAAHCLEHIVLCGSQKYPVRDPFFKMLTRSLNSYMNAWTGSDFTMYPFSTQNHKDYANLLSVYLDAVFRPLIAESDFKQEAWRLEVTEGGSLQYKGVVFNEMKGAMADPDSYYLHSLNRLLLAGSPYQYNSGGEPAAIPDLTYSDLKAFHSRFYHPSNATFFLYGDVNAEAIMREIDLALEAFEFRQVDSDVPDVPRRTSPLESKMKCPPGAAEVGRDVKFGLSYLVHNVSAEPYKTFCMTLLSYALCDNYKSPMYRALLESNLGTNYVPGHGFDSTTREGSFSLGVSGTSLESVSDAEKAIYATLSDVMKNGLDPQLIESAIHQVEIKHKEVNPNFGLQMISSMIPYALHGQDVTVPLQLNEFVKRLKKEMAEGAPVFQDLIRQHLWDNPHKISMVMKPAKEFLEEESRRTNKRLSQLAQETTDEQRTQLILAAETLALVQDMPQNIDVLPTLQVSDIEPTLEVVEYAFSSEVQGVPVHYIAQPTNGLTYIRIKIDISALPEHLRPLLPMYFRLLNKIGTKKHSHGDFDVLKDLYTSGGLSTTGVVSSNPDTIESHSESLLFRVGFLDRNLHSAFDLATELLTQPNFQDHTHLSLLIQQNVKRRTESLVGEGVYYASSLACSSLTSAANVNESLSNLKHDVELAASMLNSLSMNTIIEDVSHRLEELHRFAMHKQLLSVLVHTSDLKSIPPQAEDRLELLFSALRVTYTDFRGHVPQLPEEAFKPFVYQAYFTLPTPVNNVVEAFLGTSYTSPDFAPLTILTQLVNWNFLHKEIREKGGAYGSGAQADPHKGTLTLHSYRDPNSLKTYNAFEKAITAVALGKFDQRMIDESKLSSFSKIDKPVAVYDKGLPQFIYNMTTQMRQLHRLRLLSVDRAQIIDVAQRYFLTPIEKGLTSRVIFGSEDVAAKEMRDAGWMVERPIRMLGKQQ